MPLYCENCSTERKDDSKFCEKCGNKFGGELWVLIVGIFMGIVAPLALYIAVKTGTLQEGGADLIKVLVPWELSIWSATAALYDHSRLR